MTHSKNPQNKTLVVAVGSENPVKIAAVKEAFEKAFPETRWDVKGVNVKSGVKDQPMSDKESIRGARNRAKRALKKLNADYGVGLEGGLQKIGTLWFDGGWIVIVDENGDEGFGSSLRMHSPDSFMKHIHAGMELGHVSDLLFKKTNTKQGVGHFGLMTNNTLTRTSAYRDAVLSALARFIHPEIF